MPDTIYHTLAQRLDAIPNGFPPSASGVELTLLAKLFTPEEAALAAVMRMTPETADAIAARAGQDRMAATETLMDMTHTCPYPRTPV